MRWIFVFLLAFQFAVVGCGGCDDTTSGRSNNSLGDAGQSDAGDAEAPDVEEDTCTDCQACTDGQTRECGSDDGVCQLGQQTCNAGSWGECVQEFGPSVEVCDGVDNDCDGEVDEDPGQALCSDGINCNGVETCQAGSCVDAEPVDCSHLDEPCFEGVCLEKDGSCTAQMVADETSCDDGNFCTVGGTCNQGVCETQPRDCSGESDQCNTGVCDETADACVPQPQSDGTTCDDGTFCTVNDSCQSGTCTGGPRDCSTASDQCNEGVCDESAGSCVASPIADGSSCDDGLYCTVSDTCQQGQCASGSQRQCGASGGSCRTGVCDEAADSCTGDPVPDGTTCEDGQFCTVGDTCQAGSCAAGSQRSCAASADQCNDGICNETNNRCTSTPKTDGTGCDDGAFCTVSDQCTAGSCGGSSRDCSGQADQCNDGVCSESNDACLAQPKSDGTGCDDGAFCTVSDSCSAGSCTGSARNCSNLDDTCHDGVCDESASSCVAQALPDGTSCDDGAFCTVGDTCSSGVCDGSSRDCSAAAGTDACSIGVCDEPFDQCKAAYDSTCCDNTVDNDLDGVGQCDDCDDTNGGVYPGATETCNGVDDDCDGSIDEDFDGDGDGYSTCSTDPSLFDCDDSSASVNPGQAEACGTDGTGNGIDDDCDGYIDEQCAPCTDTDQDGDGVTECQGDCDDADSTVFPGADEICDGKDNDCNTYTTANCGASEPCNFATDNDVCEQDMICGCVVNGSGSCTGDYRCTPFCNHSQTGPVGDGCAADQTCLYDLLRSSNIHTCAVTTSTPGSKTGGQTCADDSECRSLNCDKICRGPGCNQAYCLDWCGSDDYCPSANTTCRLRRGADNIDGRCWPDGGPFVGSSAVGTSCTGDTDCDHGFCLTDPNDSSSYCTEACCTDSDCESGYTCSMEGDQIDTTYVYPEPGAPSCTTDADCTGDGGICYNGSCAWRLVETSPMCVKDVNNQGSRTAGQACSQNSQCASNFCEASLGVCLSPCCNDSVCPTGLTCEKQYVATDTDRVSQVRVCVNLTTDEVFQKK